MTPKDRTQLVIIAVGVVLLMILLLMNAKPAKKPVGSQTAAVKGEPPPPPGALEARLPPDEARIQRQRAILKEPWKRDPFQGASVSSVSGRSELNLKGIAVSQGNRPMAVINEEIVQEGDAVRGHLVKRIQPNQVVLQRGEEELILRLEEEGK